MNCVTCVAWIARGIAEKNPHKLQLSSEEIKNILQESKKALKEIGGSDEDEEISENGEDDDSNVKQEISADTTQDSDENSDIEARYGLDTYDDNTEEKPFFNISDIAVYVDNKDDEYLTDSEDEDDIEDEDDFKLKDSDNLLAVGHIEGGESSVLEIYVYNKDEGSFYVHHDIVLPAYPIALEWLDFYASEEKPGNYLAVGDMTPVIKIWNLDIFDILEPDYVLGKQEEEEPNSEDGHTDTVLSLSWNKQVRNLLASGSADASVILWDLTEAKCLNRLQFHSNKVQALQWNPCESPFLLSGCTDGHLKLYDCRDSEAVAKSWKIDGEIERVTWNIFNPFKFFCSNDKGFVHCMDIRSDKEDYNFAAHEEAVTGLDMSPLDPDILITASMDKSLKIWNVKNNCQLVKKCALNVGSIYDARLAPDLNLTVAVGGNKKSDNLIVRDFSEELKSNTEQTENRTSVKKKLDSDATCGTSHIRPKKKKQTY